MVVIKCSTDIIISTDIIDFDYVSAAVDVYWSDCRGLSLICRLCHMSDIQRWQFANVARHTILVWKIIWFFFTIRSHIMPFWWSRHICNSWLTRGIYMQAHAVAACCMRITVTLGSVVAALLKFLCITLCDAWEDKNLFCKCIQYEE